MNPVERFLTALRDRGIEPRASGEGWQSRCPAHDDRSPSLSIDIGNDGRVLVTCHAGCAPDAICGAVGLKLADLFADDLSQRRSHQPMSRRRDDISPRNAARDDGSVAVASVAKPIVIYPTANQGLAELKGWYGKPSATWTYHNAAGDPVGLVARFDMADGKKKVLAVWRKLDGSGWTVEGFPKPLPLYRLPQLLAMPPGSRILVVEGEKSADAAAGLGLVTTTSVGGSQRAAGSDWSYTRGHDVAVSVDHDATGEKYGADVSRLCLAAGAKTVRIVRLVDLWADLPDKGDIVDYLNHRGDDAAARAEIEALVDKAEPMTAKIKPLTVAESETHGDESKAAQAEQLVQLVLKMCRLGQTPKREPFAVMNEGPNVAELLGDSGGSLRATVAREYRRRYKRVMNATAFADALATLRGEAMQSPTESCYVRVGTYLDGVVLDLGTIDGAAVVVNRTGWQVVQRSPILFQRTALTGELPTPVRGGNLDQLRDLLNVSEETWPILVGWTIAALIPDMPHPILMLGGPQGTGKTTTGRYVCGLFDPSDAPTRSQPRDPEAWALSVANGWASVIDNVSSIPDWWSDALCKVVTGDGWVRRTLYTNGGVSVLSFRRVVALTSIDAGALRGDLGERLVLVDLEPIAPSRRRAEKSLDKAYNAARPTILGALLDLLVGVLGCLDSVAPATLPRMADFARVLAAIDATLGTESLAIYAGQGKRIAGEVLEADPVGEAVARFVRNIGEWSGTASGLLEAIKPTDAGKEWPRNGRGLGARLKRLAPALNLQGVQVTPPRPTDSTRTYLLQTTAQTAQPPETPGAAAEMQIDTKAIELPPMIEGPTNRPTNLNGLDTTNDDCVRSGGSGGCEPVLTNTGDGWGEV